MPTRSSVFECRHRSGVRCCERQFKVSLDFGGEISLGVKSTGQPYRNVTLSHDDAENLARDLLAYVREARDDM